MINKPQIITVLDRATLREAINPYELRLKGGLLLRSRVIRKKCERSKETYWIECMERRQKTVKEVYQVEFIKTLKIERA